MNRILFFLGTSVNQPRFCPDASWNPNGTTFADNSTIATTHNTVYVARWDNGDIIVWAKGSSYPTTTILAGLSNPVSLFVTSDNEILLDGVCPSNRVERWRDGHSTRLDLLRRCPSYHNVRVSSSASTIICTARRATSIK